MREELTYPTLTQRKKYGKIQKLQKVFLKQ